MKKIALHKFDIIRELSLVPASKLQEIDALIKSLISNFINSNNDKEPKSLAGIWKQKGFGKIVNLEDNIIKIRKEFS